MAAVAPCVAHLASPPPSSPTLTGRITPRAASRRGPHHRKNRAKNRALFGFRIRRFFQIFSYAKNTLFVCSCLFLEGAKNRAKNSPKRLLEGTHCVDW